MNAEYEQYGRTYDSSERYGKNWRPIRDRYIAQHPLCEDCLQYGLRPPGRSEEVHHIKPLSKGGTNAASNLRALCKSCHSRHTAGEGDRWHKNERIVYSYEQQGVRPKRSETEAVVDVLEHKHSGLTDE
jgi:5-methylcytosine-specific restriction protein A